MCKKYLKDANEKVKEATANFAKIVRAIAKIVVPILALVNMIIDTFNKTE